MQNKFLAVVLWNKQGLSLLEFGSSPFTTILVIANCELFGPQDTTFLSGYLLTFVRWGLHHENENLQSLHPDLAPSSHVLRSFTKKLAKMVSAMMSGDLFLTSSILFWSILCLNNLPQNPHLQQMWFLYCLLNFWFLGMILAY